MRDRIGDALELRKRINAKAIASAKVAGKATAKGQRSALAKQGNLSASGIEKEVFVLPVSFGEFCADSGLAFGSLVEAEQVAMNGEAGEALEALSAIRSFRSYRNERFSEAFTVADYSRLVKREIGYQRSGGIELGLAGYSADDVVQMAVIRSWNKAVTRFLEQTGAVTSEEAESMLHALNRRSLTDFTDAVEASDFVRYDVKERDGYSVIVKRDVSRINERIVREYGAFKEFATLVNEQASRIEFSIGDVYRNILKVRREGVSQIRRMLEGYTPEGTFTAGMEYTASEKQTYRFRSSVEANLEHSLLVASAEDDFITRHFTVQDERAELIDQLAKQDLVPAEADAVAWLALLNQGYSLAELREEVFGDLSNRRYGSMVKTAQDLLRK